VNKLKFSKWNWDHVAAHMLSKFRIQRPPNGCKLSWLRYVSYEFNYDERTCAPAPNEATREKLKRSQQAKDSPKKRSVSPEQMSEEDTPKKRAKSPSPESQSDSEDESVVIINDNRIISNNAANEAAPVETPTDDKTKVEDLPPAPEQSLVHVTRDMSFANERIFRELLDMLIQARQWETPAQTLSRELRWHREMTYALFQTEWYEQYDTAQLDTYFD
jgi:hypothetical protein